MFSVSLTVRGFFRTTPNLSIGVQDGPKGLSDSFWCEIIISAIKYFTLALNVQRDVLIAFIRVVHSLTFLSRTVLSNAVQSR